MENQQGPAGQHRGLCSILCNNLMVTRGKDGEGIVRESGMDMDTLLCLTWRTSKELLTARGTLLHVTWQPGWRGVWGRMDTCVCVAESLCCLPEIITTVLIGYTQTQNKWLKNNNNNGKQRIMGFLNPCITCLCVLIRFSRIWDIIEMHKKNHANPLGIRNELFVWKINEN